MLDILRDFYADTGPERVGFVLDDGSIVEVENVHPEPEKGFDVAAEDLVTFCDRAVASFHTHPGSTKNLSDSDHLAFLFWRELKHYVIGSDGIAVYTVAGNSLIQSHEGSYEAQDSSLWPA